MAVAERPDPASPERSSAPATPPAGRQSKLNTRLILFAGTLAIAATAAAILPGTSQGEAEGPRLTHVISTGDISVTVTEQGTLESSNNTEIKCRIRGFNTVTWIIEGGSIVKPGDELVTLDTKVLEENLSLTKTNTHNATATLERTKADVAKATIAIDAYKEGSFVQELTRIDKELEIAQTNLNTAQEMLAHSERLFRRGYITELEVEGNQFTVKQAELELEVWKTQRNVLNNFTKTMRLETLNGDLIASKSKLQADEAGLSMEKSRKKLAQFELDNCVIKAERAGMVIYPSAAAWKNAPDVTEGAVVRKDQVLLLMPDLTKMQVKVGIHESIVDRVKPGQTAKVVIPGRVIDAKVKSVATVTRPAGWWTGNVVKYDTIIELPPEEGLKPGMSAEVEIILAQHSNVLKIPVAAVVETDDADLCWVKSANGLEKRKLMLGDSNDVHIIVKGGLSEGDEVVLNPIAHVKEAQNEAANSTPKIRRDTPTDTGASTQTENAAEPEQKKEAAKQPVAKQPGKKE